MKTPKINLSANVLPEIAQAIDDLRKPRGIPLTRWIAEDPRLVSYFKNKGEASPLPRGPGRPANVQPTAPVESAPVEEPPVPGGIRLKTPEELDLIIADRMARRRAELAGTETSTESEA